MNKYILSLFTASLLLISQQTIANVYGVVIGIDAYKNYGTLDGAVNDAKILADSLNAIGAKQVKLLLDDKATRDEIKKAWDEVSGQAKAGDTVFFTMPVMVLSNRKESRVRKQMVRTSFMY